MQNRLIRHTYSLLNADQVQLTLTWRYKGIISPYARFYYIESGEGQLHDAQGTVKLEKGYLYLIPSYTMCDMLCTDTMSQYFVQFFEDSEIGFSMFEEIKAIVKVPASELDVQLFRRLIEINPNRGINNSYDPKTYENEAFYQYCQKLNLNQGLAEFYETQGILKQLSSRFLASKEAFAHEYNQHSKMIFEAKSYILKNLDSELSVADLAGRANQNTDYFSRQFKLQVGTRPLHYINHKRIERAQYLMATSSMNYTQIACSLGFDNLSYFSKSFKKITGLSPGAYKKQVYREAIR
ncbi:AraC family transcriptional regulator [Pedobacter frigidisoli]|uniref:helix-turn-helix domain-containing protein n=1 Tax=Pedobacter frigidisoli TaxID=2530455 RepID=UPI002931D3CA|nr:AraC family transcriptional regulator [Pedobacter frigidisoli]